MDLHFTAPEPDPEEMEAVDRRLADLPLNGHRRQYLLPVLHAIQDRKGWISPGALNYACQRLEVPPAEAFGVADFYALFQTRPHPPVTVHVCDDVGCRFLGGEALCGEMEATLGAAGTSPDGHVTWHRSPCLGLCERAPAALVIAAGETPPDAALAPAPPAAIGRAVAGIGPAVPMDLARSVPQIMEEQGDPSL